MAPGAHRTLRVTKVHQARRCDPESGVAADPFGRQGQDIAVEVAHERADGHVQFVWVATLCHKDHEHGPQEARTALGPAGALLGVPCPRRHQVGFLQERIEPPIREVLGEDRGRPAPEDLGGAWGEACPVPMLPGLVVAAVMRTSGDGPPALRRRREHTACGLDVQRSAVR